MAPSLSDRFGSGGSGSGSASRSSASAVRPVPSSSVAGPSSRRASIGGGGGGGGGASRFPNPLADDDDDEEEEEGAIREEDEQRDDGPSSRPPPSSSWQPLAKKAALPDHYSPGASLSANESPRPPSAILRDDERSANGRSLHRRESLRRPRSPPPPPSMSSNGRRRDDRDDRYASSHRDDRYPRRPSPTPSVLSRKRSRSRSRSRSTSPPPYRGDGDDPRDHHHHRRHHHHHSGSSSRRHYHQRRSVSPAASIASSSATAARPPPRKSLPLWKQRDEPVGAASRWVSGRGGEEVRERDRDYDRERERRALDRNFSGRERDRERGRDRNYERDRDRDRDYDRDRERVTSSSRPTDRSYRQRDDGDVDDDDHRRARSSLKRHYDDYDDYDEDDGHGRYGRTGHRNSHREDREDRRRRDGSRERHERRPTRREDEDDHEAARSSVRPVSSSMHPSRTAMVNGGGGGGGGEKDREGIHTDSSAPINHPLSSSFSKKATATNGTALGASSKWARVVNSVDDGNKAGGVPMAAAATTTTASSLATPSLPTGPRATQSLMAKTATPTAATTAPTSTTPLSSTPPSVAIPTGPRATRGFAPIASSSSSSSISSPMSHSANATPAHISATPSGPRAFSHRQHAVQAQSQTSAQPSSAVLASSSPATPRTPDSTTASAATSATTATDATMVSSGGAADKAVAASGDVDMADAEATTTAPPPPPPPPLSFGHTLLPHELAAEERAKAWKLTYDPQLDKTQGNAKTKESLRREHADVTAPTPVDPRLSTTDPRPSSSFLQLCKTSRRRARPQIEVPHWKWTKDSVAPRPPAPSCAIVMTGISPLMTSTQLRGHLRAFGRTEEHELKMDPKTGQSLGIFWLRYAHDFEERQDEEGDGKLRVGVAPPGQRGHECAARAVVEMQGRKIGAGTQDACEVHIELDADKSGYTRFYRRELAKRYSAARASAAAGAAPAPSTVAGVEDDRVLQRRDSASLTPAAAATATPAATPADRWHARHGGASAAAGGDARGHESPLHTQARGMPPALDTPEPSPSIKARLASFGAPYIFVRRTLSSRRLSSSLIHRHLSMFFPAAVMYRSDDVKTGWYVAFQSRDAAGRARGVLASRGVEAEVRDVDALVDADGGRDEVRKAAPPARVSAAQQAANALVERRATRGWTESELQSEVRREILRQIGDVFLRDVRNRILGPFVTDFLKPDARGGRALQDAVRVSAELQEREQEEERERAASVRGGGGDGDAGQERDGADDGALAALPSFRKHKSKTDGGKSKAKAAKKGVDADVDAEMLELADDDDDARDAKSDKRKKKKSGTVAGKKKTDSHRKRIMDYSSDSSDDDDEGGGVDAVKKTSSSSTKGKTKKTKAAATKPRARKGKGGVVQFALDEEDNDEDGDGDVTADATPTPVPEDDSVESRLKVETAVLSKLKVSKKGASAKSRAGTSAATARARSPSPDPFALGLAEDEEDLYYLRLALERLQAGESLAPAHVEARDSGDEEDEDEEDEEEGDGDGTAPALRRFKFTRAHDSGSARTEGFYKIPPAQKAVHLPDRNKATIDVGSSAAQVTLSSARDHRADSRKLVLGIEQHKKDTATDTDILKFNQLRSRKKQLKFAKSPIHDWGLYAMEAIPAGDMVIEYVGEMVRQQVADFRERMYEKQGNFSTYLFRVDDDLVVDATHKGNIARLMNHCCVPNCNAKILTLNGQKRIVIFAKERILKDQELTYDYKLGESGDIPCLCGVEGCRKWL